MKTVKFYLAGSIKKGKDDNLKKMYWTDTEKQEILDVLKGFNVIFMDPQLREDCIEDHLSAMGRDLAQVINSDFVLVDARERRGLGVGVEMAVAKMHTVPVVSIAPRNSHYRRERLEYLSQDIKDWIHTNIYGCSDAIVESPREAAEWVKDFLENPKPVKGPEFVKDSVEHYKKTNLHRDGLMQTILQVKPGN